MRQVQLIDKSIDLPPSLRNSAGQLNCKTKQCADDVSIRAAPSEAIIDDSHVEVDNLDDFDISDFYPEKY